MKELKEDYERRLKTVLIELKNCPLNIENETRLETKASCYKTFIAELGRELREISARGSALDWFNRLTLEEKFYKTLEHSELIAGDKSRHPDTLTGREIETIYLADA